MENKFKQEGKHLLYLKAEGLPDDSELDLCGKIHHAIITKREIVIQADMPVIAKVIDLKRIPQDTSSKVPKAMIVLEVDANGYSKMMKLIGNGYSIFNTLSHLGYDIHTLQAKEVPTAYCNPQVLSQLVYPDRQERGEFNFTNIKEDKINLRTISIYTDNESRQILSDNSHCDILIKKNKISAGIRLNHIRLSVADHVFYYKGEAIGSIATPLDSTCISIKIKQDSKNAMEFINIIKDQYPKLNFLKDVISDSIGWIESADGLLQICLMDRANGVNKLRVKAKKAGVKNTAASHPVYAGVRIALSVFESKEDAGNEALAINNDIKNGALKIIKNTIDHRLDGEPIHAIVEKRYGMPVEHNNQHVSVYAVVAMLKIPIEKVNTIGKIEFDNLAAKLYSHNNLQVATRDMVKSRYVMPTPAKPIIRKHFFGMELDSKIKNEKMHIRNKTVEDIYGGIIKSLDKIENSDSIFNAKLKLLNTLIDNSLTTPVARCSIIDAIAKLKGSNSQDCIPTEIKDIHQYQNVKQKEDYVIELIPMATFTDPKDANDACNAIRKDKIIANKDLIFKKNTELRGKCLDVFIVQNVDKTLTVKAAIEFKKAVANKHRLLINKIKQEAIDTESNSCQNSEVKDSNPNTASENKEEDAYVSMEYIDIKFENLRDAQKYADLLNKDCSKITKTEFLPIVKNDIFKDFKGLVKSAEVRTGYPDGGYGKNCYYVILIILVNKSLVSELFSKGITLDKIKQSARIRAKTIVKGAKTIVKGQLETITISNYVHDAKSAMLEMSGIIENNNMKWINASGRYEILYLYPRAIKKLPGMFKIKAKAIKC